MFLGQICRIISLLSIVCPNVCSSYPVIFLSGCNAFWQVFSRSVLMNFLIYYFKFHLLFEVLAISSFILIMLFKCFEVTFPYKSRNCLHIFRRLPPAMEQSSRHEQTDKTSQQERFLHFSVKTETIEIILSLFIHSVGYFVLVC